MQLAARIAAGLLRDYEEYREECAQSYRDGYRPHYCEHGMNQWTDYDNICGPCEDGRTMGDGLQRRELALDMAKRRTAEFTQLLDAYSLFSKRGITVDEKALGERLSRLMQY